MPQTPINGMSHTEQIYRQQVVKHYNHLLLTGLPERGPNLHSVPLEDVFIGMSAEVSVAKAPRRESVRSGDDLQEQEAGSKKAEHKWKQRLREERETFERHDGGTIISIADALSKHSHLALLGGPGSGKTMLSRWLALTFAQDYQGRSDRLGASFSQPRLPILLELRRFSLRFLELSQQPGVSDLAAEIAAFVSGHAYYSGIPAAFIADALAKGRCLLLMDGLDEIADPIARTALVDAIHAFLAQSAEGYAQNLCIITSRPHDYPEATLISRFHTCRIRPFAPEDVDSFIRRWYAVAYQDGAPEEAQELIAAIRGSDRITELASNPLLCTIIAIVYRNNRVLPNRRVDLYLKCCEALLDTWERNKQIRDSGLIGGYDWQTKLELLAPLAYWLHSETERLSAPENELANQLAEVLDQKGLVQPREKAMQEARRFIAAIRDRSGLLQERGDGTLEFAHRTFQEYLAARYIAAQPFPDYIDLVMRHLHEVWWREVHLLVVGHLGSGSEGAERASRLLLTVLHAARRPWFGPIFKSPSQGIRVVSFALGLAVGSLLPTRSRLTRLEWTMGRNLELAICSYFACSPTGVSAEAADHLAREAGKYLLDVTRDPHRRTSQPKVVEASHALLRTRPVPKVTSAFQRVLGFSIRSYLSYDWWTWPAAANSLRRLGIVSPELIDPLLQAYDAAHAGFDILERVAHRLGESTAESVRAIKQEIYSALIESIGELAQGCPAISESLITAVKDANSDGPLSCYQAVASLGASKSQQPEVVYTLVAAVKSEDAVLQGAAIMALRDLHASGATVIAAVLSRLDSQEPSVRRYAALALGALGQATTEVLEGLRVALHDQEWSVHMSAATSLAELGSTEPQAIMILARALRDRRTEVQSAAAVGLASLKQTSPDTIAALLTCAQKGERRVRAPALVTLGTQGRGYPKALTILLGAARDDNYVIRGASISGLAELREPAREIVVALVGALGDGVSYVRREAAKGLGSVGHGKPEALDALRLALHDRDPEVRAAAAKSLGQLRPVGTATVEALADCLHDRDWRVREAATSSLAYASVEEESLRWRMLSLLSRLLYDPDEDVRRAALESGQILLDGRQVHGYHWVPLRWRLKRRRRVKAIGFWLTAAFVLLLIATVIAWMMGRVDSEGFMARFLAGLAAVAGIAGGIAQVMGGSLRNPWERSEP